MLWRDFILSVAIITVIACVYLALSGTHVVDGILLFSALCGAFVALGITLYEL